MLRRGEPGQPDQMNQPGAGPSSALGVYPPEVIGDVDPGALLAKLAARTCVGATGDDVLQAASMGYDGYLEWQLNPSAIDDSACDARLAALSTISQTPSFLYAQTWYRPEASRVRDELIDATVLRAVYSRRQLLERMVEFWTNHFNIDINNDHCIYLKTIDDREVIRPFALGRFADLLKASARSPAMLRYLDNFASVAGAPNQNYAREVLELHTMGVNGGYTQSDVINFARCLTGWTHWSTDPANATLCGTFRFDPSVHDTGPKTVLGLNIPARPAAQGMQDALDVLDHLAAHPSTASFLAGKLTRWLLGEGVSASIVDSVRDAYLSSGGDIKAMIRAALRPSVLADAPPKVKRPFHLIVSALRSLKVSVTGAWGTSVRGQLAAAGHLPFWWNQPNGYPDSDQFWSGAMIPRWNFGSRMMSSESNYLGGLPGLVVDDLAFFSNMTSVDQMIFQINKALFGYEMPVTDRTRLTQFLMVNPADRRRRREAIGLAISSPAFQWY